MMTLQSPFSLKGIALIDIIEF